MTSKNDPIFGHFWPKNLAFLLKFLTILDFWPKNLALARFFDQKSKVSQDNLRILKKSGIKAQNPWPTESPHALRTLGSTVTSCARTFCRPFRSFEKKISKTLKNLCRSNILADLKPASGRWRPVKQTYVAFPKKKNEKSRFLKKRLRVSGIIGRPKKRPAILTGNPIIPETPSF